MDDDIVLANSKVVYRTLLDDRDFSVAQTTVRAGGETQWHHHTNVSDRFLVVRGTLTVEFQAEDGVRKVEVRDHYAVPPGVVHHVKNETDEDTVYIMVQSVGERDIVLDAIGATA